MTIKESLNIAINKYYHDETMVEIGAYMIIAHRSIDNGYTSTMLVGDNQAELEEDTEHTYVMFGLVSLGSGRFLVHIYDEWIPANAYELNDLFNNHYKNITT